MIIGEVCPVYFCTFEGKKKKVNCLNGIVFSLFFKFGNCTFFSHFIRTFLELFFLV